MQYLRTDGHWTKRPNEAADFQNAVAAVNARDRYRLTNVEVVLQMVDEPDSRYDLIVPLCFAGE